MQDYVRRMLEEIGGAKVSEAELEELTRRLERLIATMKRLDQELELWRVDPLPVFTREVTA